MRMEIDRFKDILQRVCKEARANYEQSSNNKKDIIKMFEKILYSTDFSDVSKKALGYI